MCASLCASVCNLARIFNLLTDKMIIQLRFNNIYRYRNIFFYFSNIIVYLFSSLLFTTFLVFFRVPNQFSAKFLNAYCVYRIAYLVSHFIFKGRKSSAIKKSFSQKKLPSMPWHPWTNPRRMLFAQEMVSTKIVIFQELNQSGYAAFCQAERELIYARFQSALEKNQKQIRALIGLKPCFYNSTETQNQHELLT